jgi:hypothetical protein
MRRSVAALALALVCGLTGSPADADPITIGFGPTQLSFPRPPDVPFLSYSESGFDVFPLAADWGVRSLHGPTPPFIFFSGNANGPDLTGQIEVTAGGHLFTFSSVDLYSSTTKIPWEFAGFRDSVEVFRTTGLIGNMFGAFKNAPNPYSTDAIDYLVIGITNPMRACLSCPIGAVGNPMGIDNIVVEQVPEPAAMMVLALGIGALQLRRFHRFSRDLWASRRETYTLHCRKTRVKSARIGGFDEVKWRDSV